MAVKLIGNASFLKTQNQMPPSLLAFANCPAASDRALTKFESLPVVRSSAGIGKVSRGLSLRHGQCGSARHPVKQKTPAGLCQYSAMSPAAHNPLLKQSSLPAPTRKGESKPKGIYALSRKRDCARPWPPPRTHPPAASRSHLREKQRSSSSSYTSRCDFQAEPIPHACR